MDHGGTDEQEAVCYLSSLVRELPLQSKEFVGTLIELVKHILKSLAIKVAPQVYYLSLKITSRAVFYCSESLITEGDLKSKEEIHG